MEDAAIREGFANLKDGKEYDALYAAALCRAKADWLVGINATRLFSVLYNAKMNVGRVQSPTLAMLVEREEKIRSFKKENYYHARITCGQGSNPSTFMAIGEKLADKAEAEKIKAACQNARAVVVSIERETKTVNPPRLYDLTTLQREANRLYGYTAQQTLDLLQSLYEKKLATYPRTDSRFLTEDMEPGLKPLVEAVAAALPFMQSVRPTVNARQVIDNSKVSDHHAVIPTPSMPKADLSSLPESERNILFMLAARLIFAVEQKHCYEETAVTLDCGGHTFTAKGKTVTAKGWKFYEQLFKSGIKEKPDEDAEKDTALPPLAEGQVFENVAAHVTEHTTTPPKPYTEDTLLAAMETAGSEDIDPDADVERHGLGTPATRAAIIEKLVSSGFAGRKKRQLLPTKNGTNLITILPQRVKSPSLTAEWENALSHIAKGQLATDVFMRDISALTSELVQQYNAVSEEHKDLFKEQKESIGICPRCGGRVVEGKKNYYCEGRDCGFIMWKDDRFFTSKKKALTKSMAAELLKSGKVTVKGLHSEKSGKTYDAVVLLADTGDKYVNYRLDFGK
jgi:DNA topoisomerase-3